MKHGIKILTLIIATATSFSLAMDWPDDKPIEKPGNRSTLIELQDGKTVQASPEEMALLNGLLSESELTKFSQELAGNFSLPLTLKEYRRFMKLVLPGGLHVLMSKGEYKKKSLKRLTPEQLESLIVFSDKLLLDRVLKDAQDELIKQLADPAKLERYMQHASILPEFIMQKLRTNLLPDITKKLMRENTYESTIDSTPHFQTSHNGVYVAFIDYNNLKLSIIDIHTKELIVDDFSFVNFAYKIYMSFNNDDTLFAMIDYNYDYPTQPSDTYVCDLKTKRMTSLKTHGLNQALFGNKNIAQLLSKQDQKWLSRFLEFSYAPRSDQRRDLRVVQTENGTTIFDKKTGIELAEVPSTISIEQHSREENQMWIAFLNRQTQELTIKTWDIYLFNVLDCMKELKALNFNQLLLVNAIIENYLTQTRINLTDYPSLKESFEKLPTRGQFSLKALFEPEDLQKTLRPLLQE